MEFFSDWQKWKDSLGSAVNLGHKIGMEDETVVGLAIRVGEFLENRIDPENPEQRVLQGLWKVADQEEQKVLANLIVRMVENESL